MDTQTLLAELSRRVEQRKINRYRPYDWQVDFHNAGADFQERMLMAANRVGKSYSAAAEVAFHATGEYPEWWEGYRCETAPLIWCGSITNETSRDIQQKELLGGLGIDMGTGLIPGELIEDVRTRQAGIPGVVDTVMVKHVSGKLSRINFKTYDQGWQKWQGTAPHIIWIDEEPDQYRIFTESQTRILTSKGRLLVTFTPLYGQTELVDHFMSGKPGTYLKTATWDDVPHLSQEDKDRLVQTYPEYERDARTKGIPMMGEGRVFTVAEEDIRVSPFEIPSHWFHINGIDFGIDHPAAGAWIAYDADADTIYLYDCYKKRGETAVYHTYQMKKHGEWIPTAWPHDGMNREKSGGKTLADSYRDHGLNMLGISARYDREKGGGQPVEPVVMDVLERMKTGKFKVFSSCTPFFEEFRNYHRKDGKIVAVKDDVLKATFYAVMMKSYGVQKGLGKKRSSYGPIVTSGVT